MANKRDDFNAGTKQLLAQRVAGKCSNPSCGKSTSGANSDPYKSTNVGVAAHICAAAKGGPRYDATMTSDERKSPQNGIWLCQTCAKLIDSDPDFYSKEKLYYWKCLAESRSMAELERHSGDGQIFTGTPEGNDDKLKNKWFAAEKEKAGIKWGYSSIDDYCSLSAGSIVLLVGYTETDVSTYAQNIVRHSAKENRKIIYFNLKESTADIVNKFLAAESFTKVEDIKAGQLTAEDWSRLNCAIGILNKSQLLFEPYDGKRSMEQWFLKAVQHSNADMIVIDDLSGLGLDGQRLSSFMYQLRSVAVESQTTIFIVLNIDDKPKRMDKRPMLSDPKINELHKFCDVVQFLYRDEYSNYEDSLESARLELRMAKNYSSAKLFTTCLQKLAPYSAIVESLEDGDTSVSKKYPGVITGLELFVKKLREM